MSYDKNKPIHAERMKLADEARNHPMFSTRPLFTMWKTAEFAKRNGIYSRKTCTCDVVVGLFHVGYITSADVDAETRNHAAHEGAALAIAGMSTDGLKP